MTLAGFSSDPALVFKGPWEILDLPRTNCPFYAWSKRAAVLYLFALPLPSPSLTQHVHCILHSQTNNELQECDVTVELHCVGSTADFNQVPDHIVTPRICQEKTDLNSWPPGHPRKEVTALYVVACTLKAKSKTLSAFFIFSFIYSYTGPVSPHRQNILPAAHKRTRGLRVADPWCRLEFFLLPMRWRALKDSLTQDTSAVSLWPLAHRERETVVCIPLKTTSLACLCKAWRFVLLVFHFQNYN
jgi:hypothetical protein